MFRIVADHVLTFVRCFINVKEIRRHRWSIMMPCKQELVYIAMTNRGDKGTNIRRPYPAWLLRSPTTLYPPMAGSKSKSSPAKPSARALSMCKAEKEHAPPDPSPAPEEPTAPSSDEEGEPVSPVKGRQPSASNYSEDDIGILVDCVGEILPTGATAWKALAEAYNAATEGPSRAAEALEKKFRSVSQPSIQ
jgi:hypothetical protein